MLPRIESLEAAAAELIAGLSKQGIVCVPAELPERHEELARITEPDPMAAVRVFVAAATACKVPFVLVDIRRLTAEEGEFARSQRITELLEPEEMASIRESFRSISPKEQPVRHIHAVLETSLSPLGIELFLTTAWNDELLGPEEVEAENEQVEDEEDGISEERITELAKLLSQDARFLRASNISERRAAARRLLDKHEDVAEAELSLIISEARELAAGSEPVSRKATT